MWVLEILRSKEDFWKCIRFSLGLGEEIISLWEDLWIGDCPLEEEFRSVYLLARNNQGIIADNYDHNIVGGWVPSLRRHLNDGRWGT